MWWLIIILGWFLLGWVGARIGKSVYLQSEAAGNKWTRSDEVFTRLLILLGPLVFCVSIIVKLIFIINNANEPSDGSWF